MTIKILCLDATCPAGRRGCARLHDGRKPVPAGAELVDMGRGRFPVCLAYSPAPGSRPVTISAAMRFALERYGRSDEDEDEDEPIAAPPRRRGRSSDDPFGDIKF